MRYREFSLTASLISFSGLFVHRTSAFTHKRIQFPITSFFFTSNMYLTARSTNMDRELSHQKIRCVSVEDVSLLDSRTASAVDEHLMSTPGFVFFNNIYYLKLTQLQYFH